MGSDFRSLEPDDSDLVSCFVDILEPCQCYLLLHQREVWEAKEVKEMQPSLQWGVRGHLVVTKRLARVLI